MTDSTPRNPFVGPRPIQQGETLYGRSTEVRELYDRLQARRIVVLHSPSGAGKSSLVQAGLIPRLKKGGFDVWKPIRVNLDPQGLSDIPEGINRYLLSAMVSLEEELPAERRRPPSELAGLELLDYLQTRPRRKSKAKRPVVLLFDQFEEVLTVEPRAVEAKRELFSAVGRALDTGEYWALFILREDYLAAFAPYRDRIPTQLSNLFRLDLLGLSGAQEALVNLAEEGGRSFPGVEQLVRDLSTVQVQQPDGSFVAEQGLHVEPVHLQVVGRRLWEAMPEEDRSIDPEDISRYASVSTALGGYYADSVRALARNDLGVERSIRDWIGTKLIVGGVRSQVRQEKEVTGGLANALIDGLLDCYLVRTEQRAGANWFELGHDRMVEPIQEDNGRWEDKRLHPLQVKAKLWEQSNRSPEHLLGIEALLPSMRWAKQNDALLTSSDREFIARSEGHHADQVKRQKWIYGALIGSFVLLCVATLAATSYYDQWEEAEAQALRAEQKEAEAWEQHRLAEAQAERAHKASLMAGARELLARGQRSSAAMLLAELHEPMQVRGFGQVALDTLSGAIPIATLAHRRHIEAAVWSPDGTRIATAAGTAVRVWRADHTGAVIVFEDRGHRLRALAWSPDGTRIAVGADDGHTKIWNADGRGSPQVIEGHTGPVTGITWGSDGTRIVTTSEDDSVRAWRADDGQPLQVLPDVPRPAERVVASPDGSRFAWRTDDGTLRVESLDPRPLPTASAATDGPPAVIRWSPDGTRIATALGDWTARLWAIDAPGELENPVVLGEHKGAVSDVVWSPDGSRLLTVANDKMVRIWNADDAAEPVVLRGHESTVRSVAWSPDDRRLLTASDDTTARIWEPNGGPQLRVFDHPAPVRTATWSPDGTRIATASEDSIARIFITDGPTEPTEPTELRGHTGPVVSVRWSADGARLLTASDDATARIWSSDGQGSATVLTGHTGPVRSATWNLAGTWVATASEDGTARLYDAENPEHVLVLQGHEGPVNFAAYSPDGTRVVTVSDDRTARLWKSLGGPLVTLEGHEGPVRYAAWSPSGMHLVTVSEDQTAFVWKADGTGEPQIFRGHEDAITFAGWRPDGRRMLTVSADRSARSWPLDGSRDPLLLAGDHPAVHAVFSSDGQRVAVAVGDTARVWSIHLPSLHEEVLRSTTNCLAPRQRQTYLTESAAESLAGWQACEQLHGRTPSDPGSGSGE